MKRTHTDKLVFRPARPWFKRNHWRTFIRRHSAPSGDTECFMQLFVICTSPCKQTLWCVQSLEFPFKKEWIQTLKVPHDFDHVLSNHNIMGSKIKPGKDYINKGTDHQLLCLHSWRVNISLLLYIPPQLFHWWPWMLISKLGSEWSPAFAHSAKTKQIITPPACAVSVQTPFSQDSGHSDVWPSTTKF